MKKYFFSLTKMLGIVVATRLCASILIASLSEKAPAGSGLVLAFAGAVLVYLTIPVGFFAFYGLPMMFCRSFRDLVAVAMAFAALLGLSEVAYGVNKMRLAAEYATSALATPRRVHDTAVFFDDNACASAPYYTKFKYIVCVSFRKTTRAEAAPTSECDKRNINVTNKLCYVPSPLVPITDALVLYDADGNHETPRPLAMAESLQMPNTSRSIIITEIVDGEETVLGRSFISSANEGAIFLDCFFGYPPLFGLHDWAQVVITPPGMSDRDGAEVLQKLQARATVNEVRP